MASRHSYNRIWGVVLYLLLKAKSILKGSINMGYRHIINVVDSHTAGDPLRLVLSGLPAIRGKTMKEKIDYLNEKFPHLLGIIMQEPRGHREMFGAILVEPLAEEADFGLIFTDTTNYYYGMCGHGTIAAATIVAEMGMVEYCEPVTEITFETGAGLVKTLVEIKDHEAVHVTIKNVPSFLYKTGIEIDLLEIGSLSVDISYGGGFFILVPVEQLGVKIETDQVRLLHSYAVNIREAVEKKTRIYYPAKPEASEEVDVFFYQKVEGEKKTYKILEILATSNQLSRSPCGTGTSALMAMLYGKGDLELQEEIKTQSFIGTEFLSRLVGEVDEGQYRAVIPQITASAYITGFNQLVVKDRDPLGLGFIF